MVREKSAGCILFHINTGNIYYLLLRYGVGHWSFPKGIIEVGEEEQEAAIREVQEETGISHIVVKDNFKEKIHYFYRRQGKIIQKEVVYFLAESKEKKVTLSFEHSDYKWLTFKAALKQLSFKNAKTVLKKAHQLVSRQHLNLIR
jgi:8-oxo-dGTP pyrophosphatase MutT (NUDIX family)